MQDTWLDDQLRILSSITPQLRKTGCRVLFEPGRFLVANSGVLLTRVLYIKESSDKTFVISDAGMNDLIRPALYDAYHEIVPLQRSPKRFERLVDVVGPICESGDFLARDRLLQEVRRGDVLAVMTAGAYGFSLSSNYNSRPRPAEVMVNGSSHELLTTREEL
jgi:diaminopimelate decarboxylase